MLIDASDLDVINAALKKGFDVEITNTDKGVVIKAKQVRTIKKKKSEN